MAIRLTTTLNKISFIPNSTNSTIIKDAHLFLGNEGRLSEDRFSRYYGNKKIFLLCNKPSSAGFNQ